MRFENVHLAYFSATYSTRKIVREIACRLPGKVTQYDITNAMPTEDIVLRNPTDLLVVGVPVYAGRVPGAAARALSRFKGSATPAIAVCVYGNRDYDDALLELTDILHAGGFRTVAAAAFVARHSIFPKLAADRPDDGDMAAIDRFGCDCSTLLAATDNMVSLPEIAVKGHRPYKFPKPIPLHPSGSKRKCNRCGTCATLCPANAINALEPYRTDSGLCISCGRCVAVCAQNARCFSGVTYMMAARKFLRLYSDRKEPECFFAVAAKE